MLSLSWFFAKLSTFFISSWFTTRSSKMFSPATAGNVEEEEEEEDEEDKREVVVGSLLDLPDLALECVLEKLSPAGLCNAAGVCTSLRNRCTSDSLWEKHMKQKWGGVIGAAALQKWRSHIDIPTSKQIVKIPPANKYSSDCRKLQQQQQRQGGGLFFEYFMTSVWPPLMSLRRRRSNHYTSKVNHDNGFPTSLPANSIMALYSSLETGTFWFPAQVYNREVQNGHVGFMLSCYDAQVSYDIHTDTFRARYSARGGQTIEENVEWKRLRKPAVDTVPHLLHVSDDCLTHLKPDDYVEIQWRRSEEFPYGWWFGVVGHLESCSGDHFRCQCHTSESVVLEFKQYSPGSRWRRVAINRKDHREVGNEADGFYGGIRKLSCQQEISTWKHFWTTSSL